MDVLAHLGAVLMLLFGGVAAGVMTGIAVNRLPVWNRMSIPDYATDFRRTVKHVDPMVPIFVALAAVGAGLFASQASGAASTLSWISLACQVVIIGASIVFGEPVNSRFRRRPEGDPPETASEDRVFWRRFHRGRTAVSIIAFVLAILSVTMTTIP